MSRLSQRYYRRKLENYLAKSFDEPMINLISAAVALQKGHAKARRVIRDLPEEAIGAQLGSPYHIPLWSLETLVNELLATPKARHDPAGPRRVLDPTKHATLRTLLRCLVKLENADDGIFLENHDVFDEMARIAQRQFPWQTDILNAPHLYRSMFLYGTGTAAEHFARTAGLTVADFVKAAMILYSTLEGRDFINRGIEIGLTPETLEKALSRISLPHAQARRRCAEIRQDRRHTAYQHSILRDFPIIGFGNQGERLRAPIPELIMVRCTTGLYLDIVAGGAEVWTEIGRRFEAYVLEFLAVMMPGHTITGELAYGTKKAAYRTPDVLIMRGGCVIAVAECKAKRMSFDARFSDDPLSAATKGFDEIAKGVFQLWRFFAHARQGKIANLTLAIDCVGIIVTADRWLAMASSQTKAVIASAHDLADRAGGIEVQDRREIAFCRIDEVEFTLLRGSGDAFLSACREISSGSKKDYLLSVAHQADGPARPYPFVDRIGKLLPWFEGIDRDLS